MTTGPKAEYCYSAHLGLWKLWIEADEDEFAKGIVWDSPHKKAYVQDSPILGLVFRQKNV
jgi:hypothetical protein